MKELKQRLESVSIQMKETQQKHQAELDTRTQEINSLQESLSSEQGTKVELESKIKNKDVEYQELVEKNKKEIETKIQEFMSLKMENSKLKRQSEASDQEKALVM